MKTTWIWRLFSCSGGVGRPTLLLRASKKRPQRSTATATAGPSSKRAKKSVQLARRSSTRNALATVELAPSVLASTAPSATAAFAGVGGGNFGEASLSLADFHPAIARTWIAAASNKMLQPQHVAPDSRKLAWWLCPSCGHQFNQRIDRHMLAGGQCPKCKAKPSLTNAPHHPAAAEGAATLKEGKSRSKQKKASSPLATSAVAMPMAAIAHKCRPNSSQPSLAAENANMLCKSVADDHYLRVQETRNLLPMLAKNFDNEKAKIGESEMLRVSPKLDGIRCVVAYRADTQQVLFFSRSGTLFECCDDAIEPALRHLFQADPTLVLDGELYNDSVNLAQLSALQKSKPAAFADTKTNVAAAFYAAVVAAVPQSAAGKTGSAKSRNASAAAKATTSPSSSSSSLLALPEPTVIRFEQLTSAIRTTRQHLTPAVAALQKQLQYHVFDVLYARAFPDGTAANVPFSVRYAFLEKLLSDATQENRIRIPHYNPLVLRCVPNFACTIDQVDVLLRAAMRLGYEGVMIRREEKGRHAKSGAVSSAKSKLKRAAASASSTTRGGGYGYGQRSSTLLKYKVMQDAEYVIVGAVEGSGKWKGSLGSFICVTADKKQQFTVTPASTDAEKKRMWRTWKQSYKGKALTVQYQELTPDGVPRFPVGKCVRGAADGHDWL